MTRRVQKGRAAIPCWLVAFFAVSLGVPCVVAAQSPHATQGHGSPSSTPAHPHGQAAATATPPIVASVPFIVVAGNGTAGFADGTGAEARFNKPIRLAPFGPDAVLVADIFNHALRIVTKQGVVKTLAGAPDRKGHADGPAASAAFDSPHGVGVAPDGRIAVAEAASHTVRLVVADDSAAGGYTVTTLAGVPGEKGRRDGAAAQALFNSPHAALWGPDGSLVTPDIGNALVRRIADGQVRTLAGDGGEKFVYPMDVAWAADGRLLVADAGADLLRAVDAVGTVTTVKTTSPLKTPHGVAVGPHGTIYVADMGTHRVLAIGAGGEVTTVAGTGEAGGDAMHLNRPAAVLVHAGWVWIADLDNHRIVAVGGAVQ